MRSKLKKIAMGLFVLLVLVCGGVPTLLWSMGGGTPNIAVDYEAKLNEKAAAVPEGDRAWPYYRDAAIGLEPLGEDEIGLLRESDRKGVDIAALRRLIGAYEHEIDLIRLGTAMPGMGFVTSDPQPIEFWRAIDHDPPDRLSPGQSSVSPPLLVNVLLPHLGPMRIFTYLLRADAELAAEMKDGERFVRDIDAMLRLADHVDEHSMLISQLVGLAIRAVAFDTATAALEEDPGFLGEPELAVMMRFIQAEPEFAVDMTCERYFFLDVAQRIYTDDGAGNGRITAIGVRSLGDLDRGTLGSGPTPASPGIPDRIMAGLLRLFSSDRATITKVYDEYLDGEVPRIRKPAWAIGEDEASGYDSIFQAADRIPPDIGAKLLSLTIPAVGKVFQSARRVNMARDATETVIAITQWRAETGVWPDSLDELVGVSLDRVPIDRFDGEPMRYRLTEHGPLLYSVGADLEDDCGLRSKHRFDSSGDADWVFYERTGTDPSTESAVDVPDP